MRHARHNHGWRRRQPAVFLDKEESPIQRKTCWKSRLLHEWQVIPHCWGSSGRASHKISVIMGSALRRPRYKVRIAALCRAHHASEE